MDQACTLHLQKTGEVSELISISYQDDTTDGGLKHNCIVVQSVL
jgi:hypothetical protein